MMDVKTELANWVARASRALTGCDSDWRIAAISALYAKVVMDDVFKSPSLDTEKQDAAEIALAKHLVKAMADFVSKGRDGWQKETKYKPVP